MKSIKTIDLITVENDGTAARVARRPMIDDDRPRAHPRVSLKTHRGDCVPAGARLPRRVVR